MKNFIIHKFLPFCLLINPLNIYVIGDFLGAGIAFPLFKFQITPSGISIINIIQELTYVMRGIYYQKTANSIVVWAIASALVIMDLLVILTIKDNKIKKLKWSGIILMISGIGFLISTLIQYGLSFRGPAGTVIPVGLPLFFVIGFWLFLERY